MLQNLRAILAALMVGLLVLSACGRADTTVAEPANGPASEPQDGLFLS